MATLELRLLGEICIRQDGINLAGLKSRKGMALLSYLAVTGKRYDRSILAGLFWPDMPETQALMNLRKVLSRMKALSPYLVITRETLEFNQSTSYWLDVKELETAATVRTDLDRLRYAVSLYQGDFLSDYDSDAFPIFDEWVLAQRAHWKEIALSSLQILLTHYTGQTKYADAITIARHLLSVEPWHEETHRELMRLLALTNHRSAALAQYETCKNALGAELGVEPALETIQLYQIIKNGKLKGNWDSKIAVSFHPPTMPLHALPMQATSLLGRSVERAKIKAYLSNPQIRLISIVGMGGIGKTHLALALAHEIAAAGQFSDGVCFVHLENVNTRTDLDMALAERLRLSLAGTREPEKTLLQHLQGKRYLIILDNFEHLLPEAGFLERILAVAPYTKILVTSLERTKLLEEWVIDLNGLPYPLTVADAQAKTSDAVMLFARRAQQMRADFSLEKNIGEVVRICHLTQGMPLALELAASQIRSNTVGEIANQIAHHYLSLSTDLQNIAPRHRSMRAVFDSSLQRLNDEERQVFLGISVFKSGFTPQAAQQVAGRNVALPTIRPILAALVDKSLLNLAITTGENTRYEMHEWIRQYAYEHLLASNQSASVRTHHLEYFLALAEQAELYWDTALEREWLLRLEAERNNIYIALDWALSQEMGEAVMCMSAALFTFWIYSTSKDEAHKWLEASLALKMETRSDTTLGARAKLLNVAGYSAVQNSAFEQAQAYFEQGLMLYQQLEDPRGVAWSLRGCSFVAMIQGDYPRAQPYLVQSLTICQETKDEWGIDWTTYDSGYLALARGNADEAQPLLEAALDRFRQHSVMFGAYRAWIALGDVERAKGGWKPTGSISGSVACYREALIIAQQNHFYQFVASALEGLAHIATTVGEYLFAARLFGAAQARRESVELARWAHQETDYQHNLTILRNQLTEATFTMAWQDGQELSLEQVIPYVLGELPLTFIQPGFQRDSLLNLPQQNH